MESIYILIPISIIMLALGIGIFVWAVRSGQFDDLESHGLDILDDDDLPGKTLESETEHNRD